MLFSVVFYILLDGIYQFPVLVWEGVRGTFGQHVIVRFGDADVEGTFAGLCSDVFHDGEVYFELHDVFHLLGSLAAFVCGLHRDVGGVQLGGKCHGLGKVLLLFGQVADLPGSGVVLLGDIGYDFLLLSSQAVQRVNLVDIAYHDFAERGQFLLQTAYLGGIAALHGAEFFQ